MNIYQPVISGSLTVTGSTTFIGNITINSGSLTMTSGSLTGTASLASNSLLLQGTGSIGFATTASMLEVSSSQQQISSSLLQVSASYTALSGSYNTFSGSNSTILTAVSSSQQQISASLLNVVANYATTGSNSFRADQSITGSLVVSSTITAQTLVVQTITSSIVYSSGSNIFGSALGDRQTFTGSVNITGSMSVTGSASFYNTKADYGLSITNVQDSSQGLLIRSSDNDASLYILNLQSSVGATSQTWVNRLVVDKAGSVGIGTTNPRDTFVVSGNGGAVLERFAETDPYSGDLYFYSAKGTAASPTTKANGDTAMGIRSRAYDGTSYLDVASIVSKIDGVVSTNVMPGNLIFSTNGGSTTLTERMKIYSAGGVVINASSTNQTLTTGDAGVTRTNTYFGTGQVRIGGGSDHGSSTVFSVAPGVVTFDRPGVGGGALTINSSGYVTLPSQPSFLAASNAGQQDYTTGQVIVFNLTRHNTSSCYNTSTGRFTAPVAGRYLFSVNFYTYASYPVSITLTINGSQYVPSDVVPLIYKPADAVTLNLGFSTILELSANDYVEIRVRSGGYTARVYMSHSHFAGQLLS